MEGRSRALTIEVMEGGYVLLPPIFVSYPLGGSWVRHRAALSEYGDLIPAPAAGFRIEVNNENAHMSTFWRVLKVLGRNN